MHRAGVGRCLPESRIAFQRHSAFRTTAGRVALDSLAHRAEVFFRRGVVGFCRLVRRMIVAMIGGVPAGFCFALADEFIAAMCRTEIKTLSVPLDRYGGGLRINFHPANWIADSGVCGAHSRNRFVPLRSPRKEIPEKVTCRIEAWTHGITTATKPLRKVAGIQVCLRGARRTAVFMQPLRHPPKGPGTGRCRSQGSGQR